MTDDQIRDLIDKPYKRTAAISTRAAEMVESETIDTLFSIVSPNVWSEIMTALSKAAAAEIVEELEEYRREQQAT
jgi:hypothetical protein